MSCSHVLTGSGSRRAPPPTIMAPPTVVMLWCEAARLKMSAAL